MIFSFALFFAERENLFAETSSSSSASSTWILASEEFTLKQQSNLQVNSKITSVLPALILEQISDDKIREIPTSEELQRTLNTLQTERLSLFLQLSKEIKTRDALVLSEKNPSDLRKAIITENKKIEEIQNQIDKNLESTESQTADFARAAEAENRREGGEHFPPENEGPKGGFRFPFHFPFFASENSESHSNETISLYKSDVSALFSPSKDAVKDGIKSFAYNKEVTAAKINGLLKGEIIVFGDYAAVTVNLYIFPGAELSSSVTEVGLINDLRGLSSRIAQNLVPKIVNSIPVKIDFEINPKEAAENSVVTIDGIVVHSLHESFTADAGIHAILVESEGFESVSISYLFSGDESFTVRIDMKESSQGNFNIKLKKPTDGIFYFNGETSNAVNAENEYASVFINGKSVLGIFTDSENNSAFIYVPQNAALNESNLEVNAKTFDRAENIDKRRRRMYTAYSALICSLPFTFFCVGNYNAKTNAYNLGAGTYEDALKWQNITYGVSVISVTCGVWFAFEMVRYLRAANQVLPAQAKPEKLKK